MKKIFLFEFCLALLGASSLHAQDAIWKNASSGSWSNSALWENGVIADGGYAADFSTSNLQSNVTVNLDGARTIGYLRIGDAIPSHDFLMSSSNASVLTLSNRSSPVPVIDVQNRTTTISHALAGSAGFKKRGNGTLILQALNSLTGEVQVNEGTLQLNYNSGGSGSLRQSIRVNPGARLLSTVSNGIGYSGNNWVRTIYLNHASLEHTVANSDFGWGVTYTLTGSSMSTTASGGRFSAGSGTLINTLASSTSSVINGELRLREGNTSNTLSIGVEDGAAAVDLLCNANITATAAAYGITKYGSGLMQIAGPNNSYGGPTFIQEGTLLVTGAVNSSRVTIRNVATLLGSGTLGGGATIEGTLSPGLASISTMRINGSVSVASTGKVLMDIKKSSGILSHDVIVGTGSISFASNLVKVTLDSSSDPLSVGDSFHLFQTASRGGVFSWELPVLPSHLRWDTTQFLSTGRVNVVANGEIPIVTTGGATMQSQDRFLLSGTLTSGAGALDCYFEWGTNGSSLEKIFPVEQTFPAGQTSAPEAVISNLQSNTNYQYRLVAIDTISGHLYVGDLRTFTTGNVVLSPQLLGGTATSALAVDSVKLHAFSARGGSSASTVKFEWGDSLALGNISDTGIVLQPREVRDIVWPISITSTLRKYYYRCRILSDHGEYVGEIKEFVLPDFVQFTDPQFTSGETELFVDSSAFVAAKNVKFYLYYSTATTAEKVIPLVQYGETSFAELDITQTIADLVPNTEYLVRLVAQTTNFSIWKSKTISMRTQSAGNAPAFLTDLEIKQLHPGSLTLSSGTMWSGSSPATYHLEYGLTENLGQRLEGGLLDAERGHDWQPVISSIVEGQTYHFQFVLTSGDTIVRSSLFTYSIPETLVRTDAPQVVEDVRAIIGGTVYLPGNVARVYSLFIEYGNSPALGTTLLISNNVDASSTPVSVQKELMPLFPERTYFYRFGVALGSSSVPTMLGEVRSFRTQALYSKPKISTKESIHSTLDNSAIITLSDFSAGGASATAILQYGTTESLGLESEYPFALEEASVRSLSFPLAPLTPDTTYYYRLIAYNAFGQDVGELRSFKTSAMPQANLSVRIESDERVSVNAEIEKMDGPFTYSLTINRGGTTVSSMNFTPTEVSADGSHWIWHKLVDLLVPGVHTAQIRVRNYNSGRYYDSNIIEFNALASKAPPVMGDTTVSDIGAKHATFQLSELQTGGKTTVLSLQYALEGSQWNTPITVASYSAGYIGTPMYSLDSLFPNTRYMARWLAVSDFGSVIGPVIYFTTVGNKYAETAGDASTTNSTQRMLQGLTYGMSRFESVTFRYGLSKNLNSSLSASWKHSDGPIHEYEALLTNLIPGMTYYYQFSTNDAEYRGEMRSFTLPGNIIPKYEASAQSSTAIYFSGNALPHSLRVEYGETEAYGNKQNVSPNGSDGAFVRVVDGLKPNTTYFYRYINTIDGVDSVLKTGTIKTLAAIDGEIEVHLGPETFVGDKSIQFLSAIYTYGKSVSIYIDYGLTEQLETQQIVTSASSISGTMQISNLQPATKYYYRVRISDFAQSKTVTSEIRSTTTANPSRLPTINNVSLNALALNAATLRVSSVGAGGTVTSVCCEYGTSSDLGSIAHADNTIAAYSTASSVLVNLTNLAANTRYYYRVVASCSLGEARSDVFCFDTPDMGFVETLGFYQLTPYGVALSGRVIASQGSGAVFFQYGTNPENLSSTSNVNTNFATFPMDLIVDAQVKQLVPDTTYSYRIGRMVNGGTIYGEIKSFKTPAYHSEPRIVGGVSASGITGNSALVELTGFYSGSANCTLVYEYGLDESFSSQMTKSGIFALNTQFSSYSTSLYLTNLLPNQEYKVRAKIISVDGTSYSETTTFRTLAQIPDDGSGDVNPPGINTLSASQVTQISAKLNGIHSISEWDPLVAFQYGVNNVNERMTEFSPIENPETKSFSYTINELQPGTRYFYRAVYEDAETLDLVFGNTMTFTTLANTGSSNSALISGPTVSPSISRAYLGISNFRAANVPTSLYVEWGTTPVMGNSVLVQTYAANAVSTVSHLLDGLSQDSRYYARFRAVAGGVSTLSPIMDFSTGRAPEMPTSTVAEITDFTAKVVCPNVYGIPANFTLGVQFGRSPQLGSRSFLQSLNETSTSFILSGLLPDTTYYARIGYNLAGFSSLYPDEFIPGPLLTFKTLPAVSTPVVRGSFSIGWGGANYSVFGSKIFSGAGAAQIYVDYGATPSLGMTYEYDLLIPAGTEHPLIFGSLYNLQQESRCYARMRVVNSYGSYVSDTIVYDRNASPSVQISGITNLDDTTVQLDGVVNSSNQGMRVEMQYVKMGESFIDPLPSARYYSSSVSESITRKVTGLEPDTDYQYRVVATLLSNGAIIQSQIGSFRTLPVFSKPSWSGWLNHSPLSAKSAWLYGAKLYAGGSDASYRLEISTTSGAKKIVAGTVQVHRGEEIAVSILLDDLVPGQNYQYAWIASNEFGETSSTVETFTMYDELRAITGEPHIIYAESAQVRSSFFSGGAYASYDVEYGSTPDFGSVTSASSATSSNETSALFSLSNLQKEKSYYYRARIQNVITGEISYGETKVIHMGTPKFEITDAISHNQILSGMVFQMGTGRSGYSSQKSWTITNVGYGTLLINNVLLEGFHDNFTVVCDKEALAHDESATLTIQYTADDDGTKSSTAYVFTNAQGQAAFEIGLVSKPPVFGQIGSARITPRSFRLDGHIDAAGNDLGLTWEYGVDGRFDQVIDAVPALVEGDDAVDVSASLVDLVPGAQYQFRLRGSNAYGEYVSEIGEFYVPSNVAALSQLSVGSVPLSPEFSESVYDYIGAVANSSNLLDVAAVPKQSGASYQVNGSSNEQVALNIGHNIISLRVTAEDGETTRDYTVRITRLPSFFEFDSAQSTPLVADEFHVADLLAPVVLSYAPQPGSILTLVNNTGSDFILGRFSNLAHGQRITLVYDGKAYDFVANYYGGTGNDLVLHWADTKLFTWGQNNFGQLGDGSTVRSLTPKEIPASALLDGKTIIAAGAGYLHSLVLCSDGSLVSWGYNLYGQLGDGSKTHRSSPVAVNQSTSLVGRRVVSIAVGPYHQLALCADGTVHAWGHNSHGQLGDGTIVDASTPILVAPVGALAGKRVVAIAAGAYHSLALCSDGSVVAWGFNEEGELGNGSNISSRVPVAVDVSGVLAGKRVTQIAAGQYHNMALCSDGTLVSWGYNLRGQLGNGSTSHANAPVAVNQSGVLAGKMIRTLRAGLFHSAVLCDDGTVALWGGNNRQQLGVAGMTQSTVPLSFSDSAEDLSSGGFFLTIRRTDGSLAAWGENLQGQLGNGTTTTSAVPVAVETSAFPADSRAMMHAAGSASLHNLSIVALPAREAPVDGIEAWRLATFGSAVTSPDAADLADCDGDGVCNLLEYAFGSNPHLADSASLPSWRKVNGFMELSITDDTTQSDIVYGAECSSTLRDDDWQNVAPTRVDGARVFRIPVNAQNRMFMRLKVTRSNN